MQLLAMNGFSGALKPMSAPENLRVETLGCRLNIHESEVMRDHARSAGLKDTIIFNTCAVTREAERQARQAIRRARRDNPGARIIVTGCAAQTEPERFTGMSEVDHVIGNAEKMQAATFARLSTGDAPRAIVNDIMSVRETAGHMIAGFGGRARAFVQIQNGCDHRCTFCIIPYGRGPSRSLPAGEVVRQIRTLTEQGFREVVLTGVDLTAYGADLPGGMTLGKLARKILKLVPELPRLRISSIDTIEADSDLVTAMAEEERLMPHLHLSLQAGDDMILKRMKRRHSRVDAVRFCAEMRRLRPDIAFGADIIAGFPTETEEMFANSLALVDECGLSHLHVFPFSPRPGTPAARMPQLERREIKVRAQRLREKGDQALRDHLRGFAGRELEILMEQPQRGRAPQFAEVSLPEPSEPGTLVRAYITGMSANKLEGTVAA